MKRSILLLLTVIAASATSLPAAAPEGNWAQFRGPGARGIAPEAALPETWSATENVAWKAEIPGRGWSSPIVWGDRVFLTTVTTDGETEEARKGLYFGGERPEPPSAAHRWVLYCLDLASGKVRWQRVTHEGPPATGRHVKNSYASETPVTDGERVYAYFGNLGLWCFDMDGKELWSKRFPPQPTRLGWGTAASPVLHGERLYLVNDNEAQSYLLALDRRTGREIWRVERDEKSNWSTPYVWENAARTEIITPGSGMVRSYDPEGKVLWQLKGMSSITIATPYTADGLLYVSSGYVGSPLRPIYAIRPGAAGDISLEPDAPRGGPIAWVRWRDAPYNPSTLVYRGRLYVLYDRGLLGCYNAVDGTPVYERERIPDGRGFTTSPWAAGDKVYALNEDGVTFVFRAGDQFALLRTNPLAEDDMCMATPAIAGNRLLIRSSKRLYCIARR
jgi:outer membrane protein assembly factor BamB